MVDAAAFIDPVVPVGSAKSGGAVVKRGLRSLNLWYIGLRHPPGQPVRHRREPRAAPAGRPGPASCSAELEAQRVPPAHVVEAPAWHRGGRLVGARRRRARCRRPRAGSCTPPAGDGWLVRAARRPRGSTPTASTRARDRVDRAELDGTDLREEEVLEHLGAVEPAALGGVVLTGVVDGMTHGERRQLLELLVDRLAPDGVARGPLARPRPAGRRRTPRPRPTWLRGARCGRGAWAHLLAPLGFEVTVRGGPVGAPTTWSWPCWREATPAR